MAIFVILKCNWCDAREEVEEQRGLSNMYKLPEGWESLIKRNTTERDGHQEIHLCPKCKPKQKGSGLPQERVL